MSAATIRVGQLEPFGDRKRGDLVDLTLTIEATRGDGFETVDHVQLRGDVLRFSISGTVTAPNGRNVGGGQNRGDLVELLEGHGDLAIDRSAAGAILELWDRWHLNDLRPWCVHLPRRGGQLGDVGSCGYGWGTAWRVERLTRGAALWAGELFGLELNSSELVVLSDFEAVSS